MDRFPRITSVQATAPATLRVRFDNGEERLYDATEILSLPQFFLLKTPAFFRAVKVDPGGYGISWSNSIHLSESALWLNGRAKTEEPTEKTPDCL